MAIRKRLTKNKSVKNKRIHIRKNKKKPLFITLVIVMIISIGVTISLAGLSGLDKDINNLDSQIAELEKTKEALIGEVSEIKSSSDIEKEAIYKLGMVYPKEEQIVYIDLSKNKEEKDVNNNVFLSPIYSVLKSFTKN
ncbi:FtsB family cell division protein [Peptoniphilus obesi]|uniref:FtsB family cell division protein n=1 Tax=Peptoniphilus obesi TaxID=1472765 RepID=UPI0004B9136F|nr:septum formation initiator family protein [Peptoniphilus obesi]